MTPRRRSRCPGDGADRSSARRLARRSAHPLAACREGGASTVETIIVVPLLMFLGLGTVQAGLIYHAKTILNYATLEAARTGATRNAQPGPMRKELGARLAPLLGGDGSLEMASVAIARSIVEIDSPVNLDGSVGPPTRLNILNPTEASFADHGKPSLEVTNRTVIPNSHLRHQSRATGGTSGQSLQDANLLKIEVTHGFELKVPFAGRMIANLMRVGTIPSGDTIYYQTNRIPLKSVATVRMQSEAWSESVTVANAAPPATGTPDTLADPADATPPTDAEGDPNPQDDADGDGEGEPDEDPSCGADGLGSSPVLIATPTNACLVDQPIAPVASSPFGGDDEPPPASPIC